MLVFLTNLGLMEFQVIFGLISSFLSNRRLRVIIDGKSSQEYPVNAGFPQGSILGPTLFVLYINDLPDDVTCNIAIYAVILLCILNVIRHLCLACYRQH